MDCSTFGADSADFIADMFGRVCNLGSFDVQAYRTHNKSDHCTVLPLLADLTWISNTDADLQACVGALVFAKRQLLRFSLGRSYSDTSLTHEKAIHRVVRSLRGRGRGLLTFAVRETMADPSTIIQLLQSATHLAELAVPLVTIRCPEALHAIAHHSALQVLRLCKPLIDLDDPWMPVLVAPGGFANLRTLRVEGLIAFQKLNFSLPCLRTLIIDGTQMVQMDEVYSAIRTIGESYHASLEVLLVRLPLMLSFYELDSMPVYSDDNRFILLLLLSCVRLKWLHVQLRTPLWTNSIISKTPFDAVDDDWLTISKSLVRLESLTFTCGPFVDNKYTYHTPANTVHPRATLRSLVSLLHEAKCLLHLNIPLHVTAKGFVTCDAEIMKLRTVGANDADRCLCLELWRWWLDEDCVGEMVRLLRSLGRRVSWCVPATLPREKLPRRLTKVLPQPSRDELKRCCIWRAVDKAAREETASDEGSFFSERRTAEEFTRYK